MIRTLRLAAVVIIGLTTSSLVLAESNPLTAAQIVEKSVAARGGLQTWRGVHSLTLSGNMDAGKGVTLPFVLKLKRPRKTRLEIQFQGETALQVYDGATGWKLRPFLGRNDVEPFTAEEARQAAAQADIDGFLVDYALKGSSVALEGQEKVEGRDAYKLAIKLKSGQTRHVWVDAASFLEVKVDGSRRMDGKNRVMETYFRDYKEVDGLMLPSVLETTVEGVKGSEKITVQSYALNAATPDTLFSRP